MENICNTSFKYKILDGLSGLEKNVVLIPENKSGVGSDGLIVKIWPTEGEPWIGIFAFGKMLPGGKSFVQEGPGKNQLTIVAKGNGYIVDLSKLIFFIQVNCCPVLDVIHVKSLNLMLFNDYTEISAYGETGLIWCTRRISWDGIKIESIDDDEVKGVSWDAPNNKFVSFKVNLLNGSHTGGSAP